MHHAPAQHHIFCALSAGARRIFVSFGNGSIQAPEGACIPVTSRSLSKFFNELIFRDNRNAEFFCLFILSAHGGGIIVYQIIRLL